MRNLGVLCLLGAGLAACAPALDWRQVRPPEAPWVASFPCRPSSHARKVILAGREVRMTLYACQADGVTWGLSEAALQDPAAVPPALRELRQAAAANLGAAEQTPLPGSVPGATPQPESGRFRLHGRLPDGQPLASEVAVFSRGTWVYQATALGGRPTAEGLETFFGGLRFVP